MKQYFTGFFTGACLVASAVMFMGASNKNLGHITVDSVTIDSELGSTTIVGFGISTYNTDGKPTTFLGVSDNGVGLLTTSNADGKQTVYLGTAVEGVGYLQTYNADGKQTAHLGTGDGGHGYLETNNKHGVKVGYFGTNKYGDGLAVLMDRYGDIGWTASGKQ